VGRRSRRITPSDSRLGSQRSGGLGGHSLREPQKGYTGGGRGNTRPSGSHIRVKSERHPLKPSLPERQGKGPGKPLRTNTRVRSSPLGIDQVVNNLIKGVSPHKVGRAKRHTRRPKVIWEKIQIPEDSWNLKRSPRLKRLKASRNQVRKGFCPYRKFKDLFKSVKIHSLKVYNRYKPILENGLLLTRRSIGNRVTPQIRKVTRLSFKEMEIIISKLPFWATSYTIMEIYDVARVAFSQHSCKGYETLFASQRRHNFASGPPCHRGTHTTYRPLLESENSY
jgi:hypothetical protein